MTYGEQRYIMITGPNNSLWIYSKFIEDLARYMIRTVAVAV